MTTEDVRIRKKINLLFLGKNIKIIKVHVFRNILPLLKSRPKNRLSQHEREVVEKALLLFQYILKLNETNADQNISESFVQVRDNFASLIKSVKGSKSIAGLPANTWRALGYYGIAIIDLMEDKPESLSRDILLMYQENPRLSRTKLAPRVYELFLGILHIKPKVVYIFRGNIPQKI